MMNFEALNNRLTIQEKRDILLNSYPAFSTLLDRLVEIKGLYVDLFCGAGGVTAGIMREKELDVLFAVNHDPTAIESHQKNHNHVIHAIEDIRTLDITHLVYAVEVVRHLKPDIVISLWASLECTHFSRAKGGDSRDADSRTLAEHLLRYIEHISPDYIDIENVVEFMSWGPLRLAAESIEDDVCHLKFRNDGGYHMIPENKKNGLFYRRWVNEIISTFGYDYDHRVLNAADFGGYTSRIRYFGQFKKPEYSFSWPEATHSKKADLSNMFSPLKKWKAVHSLIDFSIEGNSIFGRKKPLSDNTLKRIYHGLLTHVADEHEKEYFMKYYSTGKNTQSLKKPAGTITTKDRFALIQPCFIDKYYSGPHNHQGVNSPLGTITTNDKHNLITLDTDRINYSTNDDDKDTEISLMIKEFMKLKGIYDIKMRLLVVDELKMIQGFDQDYHLAGTITQQKKFIGNSVEVNLAHQKGIARIKAINEGCLIRQSA